jgi:hypothetical protein
MGTGQFEQGTFCIRGGKKKTGLRRVAVEKKNEGEDEKVPESREVLSRLRVPVKLIAFLRQNSWYGRTNVLPGPYSPQSMPVQFESSEL